MNPRGKPAQKRRWRSPRLFIVPVLLLVVLAGIMIWEILRQNLGEAELSTLPFSPTILGVAPSATLVAAILGLLLARAQYSAVSAPHLAGHSDGWQGRGRARRWKLTLHNVGTGIARVQSVAYRVTAVSGDPVDRWLPAEVARDLLRSLGLSAPADFSIHEISEGLALKPSSGVKEGHDILEIGSRAATVVSKFEVRVLFSDQLGDRYVWSKDIASEFNRRD